MNVNTESPFYDETISSINVALVEDFIDAVLQAVCEDIGCHLRCAVKISAVGAFTVNSLFAIGNMTMSLGASEIRLYKLDRIKAVLAQVEEIFNSAASDGVPLKEAAIAHLDQMHYCGTSSLNDAIEKLRPSGALEVLDVGAGLGIFGCLGQ
jgi:hypothetical protein